MTSAMDADGVTDNVWGVRDLRVFDELQKPVAFIVHGLCQSSHSIEGLQAFSTVIHYNSACQEEFGRPRSAAECAAMNECLSEEDRQLRQKWLHVSSQGDTADRSWVSVGQFLGPLFQAVTAGASDMICQVETKAIKIETSANHVETALMHVFELETRPADLRIAAIHSRSPLHTFMFSSDGSLLNANPAAFKAFQYRQEQGAGGQLNLRTLFDEGIYPGDKEGAQAAYNEALNAVFNLEVQCHRHTQLQKSKDGIGTRWSMIEMWPMLDPVDSSPAVLVKRHNISQQKHLELQLTAHQDALETQNQELEHNSHSMHEQQVRLQQEAEGLAQRLKVILHDKFQSHHSEFDSDTPIDKTITFLQAVIGGKTPSIQVALELCHILSESGTNLRQPVSLETQLLADQRLDSDVSKSMLQLLQGSLRKAPKQPDLARHGSTLPFDQFQSVSVTEDNTPFWLDSRYFKGHDDFVPSSITTETERFLLDAESNWHFDVFAYAETAPANFLALLTFHLFSTCGFIQRFGLDAGKLWLFAQRVESGYNANNPYHNSIHVASVLQMTHMLLCHGGIMQSNAMTKIEQMSAYWSALIHDFEHGGLNNDFLIKTGHALAITYNDQSPLESHHLAAAVRLMRFEPQYSYVPISFVRSEHFPGMRTANIAMVMGTDMKKHFDIMSRFQATLKRDAASNPAEGGRGLPSSPVQDWETIKPEDKTLLHQMVLKCADISHLAADMATHKRWAYLLEEEFFRQGDQEKAYGLPVSPLMDRSLQGGMTRSQMGFFSIVGIPMFRAMVDAFPDVQPMLDGVNANYAQWEQAARQAADKTG